MRNSGREEMPTTVHQGAEKDRKKQKEAEHGKTFSGYTVCQV